MINPEWEPWHDDNHHGGQVDGDDVETDLPGEQELYLEAAVLPGAGGHVTVTVASVAQDEATRQTQIVGKL